MILYRLAVRIDRAITATLKFLDDRNESGWGVREFADSGEHWHFFVETKTKPQPFRVALVRAVPDLKGNGAYSVAECRDVEKYLRYMAKGDEAAVPPEVVWKVGPMWTPEKIDELHEAYWQENRELKRRRKEGSVIDAVIDVCKEKRLAWEDRSYIAEEYIKELVSRNKVINIYSVKSAVNLIQVKLCPDDSAIKNLAAQVTI